MLKIPQNTGKTSKGLVLYAPLDWGLGHTTRSIPVISTLLRLNYNVLVACNSTQKTILTAAFPDLEYIHLDGYNINYGRGTKLTAWKIIFQIPKILTNIKREKALIKGLVASRKPVLIISDNRYGCRHKDINSIIITHQLLIKTGWGKGTDRLLQWLHYRFINRFTAVWVPDFENRQLNLAGELSHPEHFPSIPVSYIGALSRLEPDADISSQKKYLLVLLSGPEPQRTLLENRILQEASSFHLPIVLVRGLANSVAPIQAPNNVTVIDYLSSTSLQEYISSSIAVISRSGYTSVMDFARMKCKSILVPTPGQTEQEYLAQRLAAIQFAPFLEQAAFTLKKALEKSETFAYQYFEGDMEQYKKAIADSIQQLPINS